MADTEATRALFRELLGMTGGANASGRGKMHIPDDIMDSMAGDAAQESMARDNLIMEMRNREDRSYGARFIGLELMEMEATDVDGFLSKARKKIIKRSKGTRKGCCVKIGGVLDQMLGAVGGDYADPVAAKDRGAQDPIGEATENEILAFISEEFASFEHDDACMFADPKFSLAEGEKFLAAPKRPGLLRDAFNLQEGEGLSVERAQSALATLQEKKTSGSLHGKDASLLPRLEAYVKMGSTVVEDKGAEDKQDTQEENVNMQPSRTASALSSFMEASNYKKADAGNGKGSPDAGLMSANEAGDLTLKTRPDNAEYPTELMPAKSGGKKTAGKPTPLGTRGKDRGDPIGEDENLDENLTPNHIAVYKFRKEAPETRQARISHYKSTGEVMESEETTEETAPRISETANALANFMEANGQYAAAKQRLAMAGGDAGDLTLKNRPSQKLGAALEAAKTARKKAAGTPRYDKGADPIGDADDKGAGKN